MRGLVWIGVGAALFLVGLAMGRPLVLRGTRVNIGYVIAGIGAIIFVVDSVRRRRGQK